MIQTERSGSTALYPGRVHYTLARHQTVRAALVCNNCRSAKSFKSTAMSILSRTVCETNFGQFPLINGLRFVGPAHRTLRPRNTRISRLGLL